MTRRTFRLAIEGAAVSTLLALAVSFLLIRVLSLVPPLFPLLHPASTNAAAGSAASAVRLTCDELERASRSRGWIDVCKGWEEDQ